MRVDEKDLTAADVYYSMYVCVVGVICGKVLSESQGGGEDFLIDRLTTQIYVSAKNTNFTVRMHVQSFAKYRPAIKNSASFFGARTFDSPLFVRAV